MIEKIKTDTDRLLLVLKMKIKFPIYFSKTELLKPLNFKCTRDSLQRKALASECSLQRVQEGTPLYPTCCYARYCFKFRRALPHSSGGREVDQMLVVGNGDAFV